MAQHLPIKKNTPSPTPIPLQQLQPSSSSLSGSASGSASGSGHSTGQVPSPSPQISQSTATNQIAGVNGHVSSARQSRFRFRAERAEWLTGIGIVVTIVALVSATIYAVDAFVFSRWSTERDFWTYCKNIQVLI
jgi:hypothetical protein